MNIKIKVWLVTLGIPNGGSENYKRFFRYDVTIIMNLQMPEIQNIKVNNHVYKVAMNDQTRMYAMKLKRLYMQSYTDVDSFDEVSSEISTTLNNLLKFALSPEVLEEDMDGAVKQVLTMFEKNQRKWSFRRCLLYVGNDLDLTHNTDDILPLPNIETLSKEYLILIDIIDITLMD